MRILLLNQFYPPDPAPTGQALHDLARVLKERGHGVQVLCSRGAYAGAARYAAREDLDGIEVRRLPGPHLGRASLMRRGLDYASFHAAALAAVLTARPRPDLVLALTTPPFIGLAAAAAARGRGLVHAHWVMDVYPDALAALGLVAPNGLRMRALQQLARAQLRGAGLVLGLGAVMDQRLADYAPATAPRAWVPLWGEPIGAAGADVGSVRRARGWSPDDIVFMYSGNLGLGHRFGEILEAARRLGPAGPKWAFAGGGPRRVEVERFAREEPGVRVELLPYVPRESLPASLAAADVHLATLSPGWEGVSVPSKIAAVFSVGRPAIFVGPRRSEAAEWIAESGGGWVVPEDDVDALLAAVRAAREPGERSRRGARALAYARLHFDRHDNCSRIAEMLERCVAPATRDDPQARAGGEPRPSADTADARTAMAGIWRSKSTKQ
jgi:glycosyltransferase involved in cell wall biosynthesis